MDCFVEEVLLNHDEIVERSKELGRIITSDYKLKTPLLIGLLKGSIPFMAELIKYIDCPMEIDFMKVSSYLGTESTGRVNITSDLAIDISGRDILIVEDIVDSGLTLMKVIEVLNERKPNSIEIVTLLNKNEGRIIKGLIPKYIGFSIPNKFVIGFGLDYNELYRNLDYIGVLKPSIYMK